MYLTNPDLVLLKLPIIIIFIVEGRKKVVSKRVIKRKPLFNKKKY